MRYSSIFVPLSRINNDEVPIFIPTFNQPSLLKMTLEQLAGYERRVVVYDNNSTYEEMRDYLLQVSNDIDVVASSRNDGPRIFTEDVQILSLMPDYFIVTDPDLIHNPELPDNHIDEMKRIIVDKKLAKVGFALEVHDKEEVGRFLHPDKVLEWELHYWDEEIGVTSTKDRIFNSPIDTTYSLNSREECLRQRKFGKPTFRYPSARVADKYTCRHVGWWRKDLMPQSPEEINHYLKTQKWSHTENYYYK